MRYFLCLLILALAGCAVLPPVPSSAPGDPAPTPTPVQEDVWQPLSAGAEILITAEGLVALRHTPTAFRYDSQFESAPDLGKPVGGWLAETSSALAAVNCGFYYDDEGAFAHIGLLMTDGKELSPLRSGWGGVVIVRDGAAFAVRHPARLLAPAALGIQGWPMLVEEGQAAPQLDASEIARRTAVGVDAAGRVVWVATPFGLTLADFARRLLAPDLALVAAINLDGGSSTGLRWRSSPGAALNGPESLPVPCAIALLPFAEPSGE